MRWTIVVACMVAIAGCVDTADEPQPEAPEAQYEDPEQNFTLLQPDALPTEPPAPGERTLAEAPLWRLGEWWTYDVEAYLNGQKETITRVVAGTEHDNFLVGFPIDQFSNFALVLHHPAYGDIARDHISYDTHDHPFKPMDFPLVEGKTWETNWQSASTVWTATVTSADNATGEARIDFTVEGTNALGQATSTPTGYAIYDAEMGVAKILEFHGYGHFEVTAHGFSYEGDVRVPHDHDLVFFHGRLGGVQGVEPGAGLLNPNPQAPDGTIDMPAGYDRVSFGLLAQDVPGSAANQQGTNANSGYYKIDAFAPDGTQYTYEMTPADMQFFGGEFYEHENPEGQWRYTAVAGGGGVVFIEGIGYHSIDISLPSGCVIASANANHHVQLCKAE